jgi:hypothetical protein
MRAEGTVCRNTGLENINNGQLHNNEEREEDENNEEKGKGRLSRPSVSTD